ncbi:hypothetical protein BUE82_29345 [Escherichia coli]|nr:hypothetical protein BUE82_29345 [Escherichia coli]
MLPSETMIWQPEFTDKTLSRKPGAVQTSYICPLLPLPITSPNDISSSSAPSQRATSLADLPPND